MILLKMLTAPICFLMLFFIYSTTFGQCFLISSIKLLLSWVSRGLPYEIKIDSLRNLLLAYLVHLATKSHHFMIVLALKACI